MKKITYILFAILLSGCATKKTISEIKEVVVRDTITNYKTLIVTKPIKDTLVVENPCDSLGILKDFKQTINNGAAKVVLENKSGNIQATVNVDSLVNSKIEIFKSNYKTEKEFVDKEVIKWKIPLWVWLVIGLQLLTILLLLRFK